ILLVDSPHGVSALFPPSRRSGCSSALPACRLDCRWSAWCPGVSPSPRKLAHMATEKPRSLLRLEYENAAQAYLHLLRTEHPEHFMEATSQAYQREITVEGLALLKVL